LDAPKITNQKRSKYFPVKGRIEQIEQREAKRDTDNKNGGKK